jgi:rhamnose utilization protein RhaD (predicted bifunctional aldolase and dehydrogenase)/NAD(P)-dependent dehydrogenase (short-subunit alcohol dehydrogenase family)
MRGFSGTGTGTGTGTGWSEARENSARCSRMKSLWNEQEAAERATSSLALRVYTSRLLGREPALVLHGGGNTSVKVREPNLFGEAEHLLYVKGSGWDLATIEAKGFAPVRMDTLLKLAALPQLSDTDMVRVQKAAMTDPNAPTPSVEAILHALIPFDFVDHTHSDAVVAITNTPGGEETIKSVLGSRVLYIPYVMPGFALARLVYELTRDTDWSKYDGMVLQHHGIFSFANDGRQSYERMLRLVTAAEDFLSAKGALKAESAAVPKLAQAEALHKLAALRKEVSLQAGVAMVALLDGSANALGYANLSRVAEISGRGPLTPDHVIHTKRTPMMLGEDVAESVAGYARAYLQYFDRNASAGLVALDPAPKWVVWPQHGVVSFGQTAKRAGVVADIVRHTMRAQGWAETLGGWQALPERDIFDVEYWELEQAKIKKGGTRLPLEGKVALVTGAAGGIGKACVDALRAQGAAVAAVDLKPTVESNWQGADVLGLAANLSERAAVDAAVAATVRRFGGLDIVVANAGIFPASAHIEALEDDTWHKTLEVNLTSQMYLLRAAAPYLRLGLEPAIVVVASKNVAAPGPGAAAYSASKAALTQLARVAALELGPRGVRVNLVHPHAVMDTALWTPEILHSRAQHYGMSVEEYKRNNLLKVEVKSKDVAELVAAMAGPLFAKTTGAQVPIDGGSDRII